MKLFCKSQFPHKFVNVFVILVIKTCPTLGIIPTLNNVITCRVYATRQVSCKVIAFSINWIPDRNQQGHCVSLPWRTHNHTVDLEGFVASMCEGPVTKFAPHKALSVIARGKLTFCERVVLHRDGLRLRCQTQKNAPHCNA